MVFIFLATIDADKLPATILACSVLPVYLTEIMTRQYSEERRIGEDAARLMLNVPGGFVTVLVRLITNDF